ncbi:AMIN-like domain-containing (lipo)protein [Corynebacterium nasicanis]|uniref:AMIN-like domain-containing protein n=1 Tax=Corynebacterium nasicanis TaxID=1448267 RepID=A0ABW1QE60_9CORY
MTDTPGPLRKSSPRRTSLAAVLAAGALGLAACGTGVGQENRNADGDRSLMETLTAATLGGNDTTATGAADVAQKTARPDAPAMLMVESVRVAAHDGFDRVDFDLVGDGEPGWFVDYTTTPKQQGSGNPVEVKGSVFLNVNIDGTTYPFELGREDPHIGTVAGAGNLTEVVSVGTFEGRSQFAIGMKEKLPYSVEVLHDPHRLVIDIRHR